jgi:hypothetical protein
MTPVKLTIESLNRGQHNDGTLRDHKDYDGFRLQLHEARQFDLVALRGALMKQGHAKLRHTIVTDGGKYNGNMVYV